MRLDILSKTTALVWVVYVDDVLNVSGASIAIEPEGLNEPTDDLIANAGCRGSPAAASLRTQLNALREDEFFMTISYGTPFIGMAGGGCNLNTLLFHMFLSAQMPDGWRAVDLWQYGDDDQIAETATVVSRIRFGKVITDCLVWETHPSAASVRTW